MRLLKNTVLVISLLLLFSAAVAQVAKYEVLDKQKIYYGDCTSFDKPATVAIDEIFPHIYAYKLIKERKLNEKDPEYWVLLLQANEVFRKALKTVAATSKHDLIAERGVIKPEDNGTAIVDITHLVIAELQRNPEDSK
jgi:hypothetical protein